MSRHEECRHCEGTGHEAPLGVGSCGTVYAGVCSFCFGHGWVEARPKVLKVRGKDGRLYATQADADEAWEAIQREAAERRAAYLDRQAWFYANEHYI